MRIAFLFMLLLSPIFAFSVEDIVSISLDNVPYISNLKNLIEFISGNKPHSDQSVATMSLIITLKR